MDVKFLCSIKSLDCNIPPAYIVLSGLLANNLYTVCYNMWSVITAWKKNYWALTASTQLISFMMRGDSLTQLIAQFPLLWKGKIQYGITKELANLWFFYT